MTSIWPKVPPGFVRAVLAGHSALGLFFAAALYLVCLSGTLVVFHGELHQWEQPQVPPAQATSDEAIIASLDDIAARAHQHEDLHGFNVVAPGPLSPWLTPRFYTDAGFSEDWIADPQTGELLALQDAPFSEFLASLHIYLRLPAPWGIYLVGLIGVAMLSLVISGLLAHPRIFKDAFALRWGGSKRLQEADLHNRLSVWALPFHIVISFTGAFLGLAYFVVGILALVAYEGDQGKAVRAVLGPQPSEEHAPVPTPDLAALIEEARASMGGGAVSYVSIEHPGTQGQLIAIDIEAPRDLAASETFFFDAQGALIESGGQAGGALGKQVLATFGPLHFGSFGGLPVKFAYLAFGFASTIVAASGVSIWLARRRDRGRPAPRWEKIWTGAIWGGALGCSTPGLATAVAPNVEAATTAFVVTLVAALASAILTANAQTASRFLRGALACVLALLVVLNAATHGSAAWSGAPLGVNVALLASAIAILVSFKPVRRLSSPRAASATSDAA